MWRFYSAPLTEHTYNNGDKVWLPVCTIERSFCCCTLLSSDNLAAWLNMPEQKATAELVMWVTDEEHQQIMLLPGVRELPEPPGWSEHRCDYDDGLDRDNLDEEPV